MPSSDGSSDVGASDLLDRAAAHRAGPGGAQPARGAGDAARELARGLARRQRATGEEAARAMRRLPPALRPSGAHHLVDLRLVEGVGGAVDDRGGDVDEALRSEEHTSELQSLMRISYAVFCLKKKN